MSWKSLQCSCEVRVVQLTHTVWTQVGDTEWMYYTQRADRLTVLCAERDPVDIRLKETGRLRIDPTCKGYSKTALLQPVRVIQGNSSNSKNNRLMQIPLSNDCCEELGTRLNFSTSHFNLKFQETVSHADDWKYAGVKVRDFEKHLRDHEWREKHSITHQSYSIMLYTIVSLVSIYRLIRCVQSRGKCARVTGSPALNSRVSANRESTGLGNVVNINIKTSNESLTVSSEPYPCVSCHPPKARSGKRRRDLTAAFALPTPTFDSTRF
jgi:hypothetical protein